MGNYNIRSSVYLLILVSAVSFLMLAFANGIRTIEVISFLRLVPNVVTIDIVVIMVFSRWLWRCRIFKGWLVPFEDLNGTWLGVIKSSWVDEESGRRIDPIPAMITIRQSFFRISCKVTTGEMRSISYIEGYIIDKERQTNQITFSYKSTPKVLLDSRSLPHDGSAILDVLNVPNKKLLGKYWTDRKTNGELEFSYYSNEMLEELPENTAKHPMA